MNPDEGSDIDVANEIKFGYSNDVDDKSLSGQLDTNVEEEASCEESTTEVLDEPGTGPVFVQDNPDQVKLAEIKQLGTDVDDSATNVSGTDGDNQSTVVVDISAKLVQLGDNVVDDVEAEKCGADVLGEAATEPVSIPDDHVENELCLTDIAESVTKVSKEEGDNQSAVVADIASNLVFGGNVVDTRENEAHTTDFDESTVNVSEAGDSQSLVIPDVHMAFVPDDNVVDQVQREQSTTEALDDSTTEPDVSNLVDQVDFVEGETSAMSEPVKNSDDDAKKDGASILEKQESNDVQAVSGTEEDDVPVILNVSTKLVPDDKVVDLPPSGRTCSDCLITEDVHSSGAEATFARALSAGSPTECEEPCSGYVDIDSVKIAEQVSNVPSTHVANVFGKEGFSQPPNKVEGREFDNN